MTVAAVAAVGVAVLPATGARTPSRADELRRDEAALAAKERAAELELYAIEAQVRQAQAALTAARARADAVARERQSVARQVGAARRSVAAAHTGLERRLRALYEQGGTDTLEILLSSESIEAALTTIDGLDFAAQQDQRLVHRTEKARAQLLRLQQRLAGRAATLARLQRDAEARAAALTARHAERQAYLVSLARERRLKAEQIAAIRHSAAAAQARSAAVTRATTEGGTMILDADPGTAPAPTATAEVAAAPAPIPASATAGQRTLVVSATAYALKGRTASGLPTGWGVAAVDPSVIPMGTRFFVPGYGEAVAADVGSAVRGNEIDLWFPSLGQARAWGRRSVTIVIH